MKANLAKIALLSLVTLTSTFFCITACMAWFAANRSVSGDGIHIKANADFLNAKYTIYKYDEGNNIISTTNPDELVLKAYDSIILEKNNYIPIIIKFDIKGKTINEQEPFTIKYACSETSYDTKYVSNIIKFNANYLTISSTNIDTIYQTACQSLDSMQELSFVSSNNDKTTLLTQTFTNYASYVQTDTLSLYIKIDYNKDLIQQNFSEIEIATEQENTGNIFENDITRIEIDD